MIGQTEASMTPENLALVRDSFAKVVPIAPQAAALFYDRLFVLDPSLKLLFKGDMTEQGRMLMAMIGTAVANLDQLEAIVPAVHTSADGTRPMASSLRITTSLHPRCSGRSGKGWEMLSRPRWRPLGRKPIRSLPQ
jgi:hypothetical protein